MWESVERVRWRGVWCSSVSSAIMLSISVLSVAAFRLCKIHGQIMLSTKKALPYHTKPPLRTALSTTYLYLNRRRPTKRKPPYCLFKVDNTYSIVILRETNILLVFQDKRSNLRQHFHPHGITNFWVGIFLLKIRIVSRL